MLLRRQRVKVKQGPKAAIMNPARQGVYIALSQSPPGQLHDPTSA